MIVSEIIKNSSKQRPDLINKIKETQIITVQCDDCGKSYMLKYRNQKKSYKKYNKDLCRGCKQREQIKLGIRGKQYKNAGESYRKKYKGKTQKEILGDKKYKIWLKKIQNSSRGENNPMYGKNYQSHGLKRRAKEIQGKTYEEIYGNDVAKNMRLNLSDKFSGENNPMYGKPTPQGSGNGWSGWYKKYFFRSIRELSFIVNVLEKNNIIWESGELKKYKIQYTDYGGKKRNYFADFVYDNKIVEIKPRRLQKSKNVILKKEAAVEYAEMHNFKYQIIFDDEFELLSSDKMKDLIISGQLIFLEKYRRKYEQRFGKI